MHVLTALTIPASIFYIMHLNHRTGYAPEVGESITGLLGGFRFILLIVLCVTCIMWFRRAYHNPYKIGISYLSYSEGWAAGAWFVPFMNLVRPYTIMKEIWTNTQDFVRKEGEEIKSSSILGWWWALYLIGNFAAQIGFRIELASDGDPDMIQLATLVGVLADLLDIIDILIIIKIIKTIAQFEDRLFHHNWKDFFGDQTAPTAGMNPPHA